MRHGSCAFLSNVGRHSVSLADNMEQQLFTFNAPTHPPCMDISAYCWCCAWMREEVCKHINPVRAKIPQFLLWLCIYRGRVSKLSVFLGHTAFLFTCDMNRRKWGVESMTAKSLPPSPSACTACQTRRRIVRARNNLELNWSIIWLMRNHWMYRPPELLSVAYTVHTLKIKKVRFVNYLYILIGERLYTI